MRKFRTILWRSLLVAVIYTFASTLIGSLVLRAPEGVAPPTNHALLLATTLLSGFLIGATLGPLAARLYASRLRSGVIYATVLFLNMASVVIEGHFFAPGLLPASLVPRLLVLHAFSALVTAMAMSFLFPARQPAGETTASRRPPLARIARFALSAAAYLLFYYGFGAINYALVTGPYYASHPALAVPPAGTVLLVASLRSVLILLSLLPLIAALRLPRGQMARWCGGVLFVVGGVLPLLLQTGSLPPLLLAASGVEIFFQNFLTGVVAALLLGRPQAAPARPRPAPAIAEEEKV